MPTISQLEQARKRAEAAGDREAVDAIADQIAAQKGSGYAGAPGSLATAAPPGTDIPRSAFASEFISRPSPDVERTLVQLAARGGPPMLVGGAMTAAGFPPPATAYGMGLASIAGGKLGDVIEGDYPRNLREGLGRQGRDFAFGATPVAELGVAPASAGFLNRLLNSGRNVGRMGGSALEATGLGNYLNDAITQGSFTPYDKAGDNGAYNRLLGTFKGGLVPAVTSAGLGLLGTRFANANARRIDDQEMTGFLAKLGVDAPELGQIRPKYAATMAKMEVTNPQYAEKLANAKSPITRRVYELVGGEAPGNEAIATSLQPFLGKIDEAESAYQAADKALEAARAEQAKLKVVADKVGKDAVAPAMDEALRAEAAALSQKAEAHIAGLVAARPLADHSVHAAELTNQFLGLKDVINKRYGALLQQGQVDTSIPLAGLTREAIANAVQARLAAKGASNSLVTKDIIDTIKGAGGPDVAPVANAAGKITKVEKDAAEAAAMQAPLSLKEVADLRGAISERFGRTILDQKQRNRAEALASDAYEGILDVQGNAIKNQFGQPGVDAHTAARKYYADLMRLRDNEFGRNFLNGTMDDATVKALAGKMVDGSLDEVNNFKQYIAAVAKYDPAHAAATTATMQSAVKNSILQKATDQAGVTDPRALYDMLNRYDRMAQGGKVPFGVDFLGYGNSKQIEEVRKVLKDFSKDEVSTEALDALMRNPEVQKDLLGGGTSVPKSLRPGLAMAAFNSKVQQAAVLRAAGKTAAANEAYQTATNRAAELGKTRDDVKAALDAAKADPVLAAFDGYGKYTLTNEAQKVRGSGTISDYLGQMKSADAKSVLDTLREKQPDLADLIERRLIADKFATSKIFVPDSMSPDRTTKLDFNAARNYFFPAPEMTNVGEPAGWQWLRKVITPAKADRIGNIMTNIAKLDAMERQGRIDAGLRSNVADLAGIARGVQSGGPGGGSGRTWVQNIIDMMQKGRYHTVSAFVTDKGFANKLYENSGDIAKALGSMPIQKAYLLTTDREFMDDQGRNGQPPPQPVEVPKTTKPTTGLLEFNTLDEANAAGAKGLLKAGMRIKVGGKSGTWA